MKKTCRWRKGKSEGESAEGKARRRNRSERHVGAGESFVVRRDRLRDDTGRLSVDFEKCWPAGTGGGAQLNSTRRADQQITRQATTFGQTQRNKNRNDLNRPARWSHNAGGFPGRD